MIVLGYVLALVIGFTLGLFGGGGSILTVPVFVYVLHYDPKMAIAMSLPVVGATSLAGAIGHWRAGHVRLSSAVGFGACAMVSAFLAARWSVRLNGRSQILLLGVTMFCAAALMLRDSLRPTTLTLRDLLPGVRRLTLATGGVVVGALTGLIGIGGGFLIVPVLVVFARIPVREAVGTSLLVITMNSIAGFAGQAHLGEIPRDFVITFSLVAIVGVIAGTKLSGLVEPRLLKRAFAALLLAVAAFVLWQNQSLL